MSQTTTSKDWKQDPRLKGMNQNQLTILMDFATQMQHAPDSQKLSTFLSLRQKLSKSGITFSPPERELLISILMESLSPDERSKVQMMQTLLSRL